MGKEPSVVDVGIVTPSLGTGLRVEGNHSIERRAEVQSAIHHDGSGFESASARVFDTVRNIAGVVDPGNLQMLYVRPIDLRKR